MAVAIWAEFNFPTPRKSKHVKTATNPWPATATAPPRKRYAEYFYKQGKTMEAIGELLGVSQRQISRDLEDFNLDMTSKSKRAKTATDFNFQVTGKSKHAKTVSKLWPSV